MMPLANNLQPTRELALAVERYPLQVLFCEDCSLSQLSIIIDPKIMFSHYVYRSSINKGYVQHCKFMAQTMQAALELTADSFVIDIAGNDGALLNEFKQAIGCCVLNIDPAENLVPINDAQGIRQFTAFWGAEAARHLQTTGWPKADLITATNVFAHVHDVKDFLKGVEQALTPTGRLVLEFPYLINFIEHNEFDTVYFEHLSYWSITPLMYLVTDCGLKITRVERFDIHGGTVRVTIAKQWSGVPVEQSVDDFVQREEADGYNTLSKYSGYADIVEQAAKAFMHGITGITRGASIAAFAASAKGNTLLNYADKSDRIEYIIDETPEKIGQYTPGNGLPIVSIDGIVWPGYLIILSWNFKDEIIKECRSVGYTGKFIIPIPEWQEVE